MWPAHTHTHKITALSLIPSFSTLPTGYATQAKSSIISIGLTIHNTPVELREKLAVPEAEWPRAIEELCSYPHIEEAGILSTCNRMELYVVAVSWHRGVREVRGESVVCACILPLTDTHRLQFPHCPITFTRHSLPHKTQVEDWMSRSSGVPLEEMRPSLFLYKDRDATRHLMRVAGGLDSLVMGEGQILAQVCGSLISHWTTAICISVHLPLTAISRLALPAAQCPHTQSHTGTRDTSTCTDTRASTHGCKHARNHTEAQSTDERTHTTPHTHRSSRCTRWARTAPASAAP